MTFSEWLTDRFAVHPDRPLPPRKGDVAERVGVSASRITAWLDGAQPAAEHIGPLADALNLSAEERVRLLDILAAKGAA